MKCNETQRNTLKHNKTKLSKIKYTNSNTGVLWLADAVDSTLL